MTLVKITYTNFTVILLGHPSEDSNYCSAATISSSLCRSVIEGSECATSSSTRAIESPIQNFALPYIFNLLSFLPSISFPVLDYSKKGNYIIDLYRPTKQWDCFADIRKRRIQGTVKRRTKVNPFNQINGPLDSCLVDYREKNLSNIFPGSRLVLLMSQQFQSRPTRKYPQRVFL
jgi:hypothetical protein